MMNTPFITSPAVFAAGRCYQIMAVTDTELLYWVEINGKNYYDASNGVMRSACRAHRAVVPMEELDKARRYTICFRRVLSRNGPVPVTGEIERIDYSFRPVPEKGKINIYQAADAHQLDKLPHMAGKYFGKELHLLVLNGDTFDFCHEEKDFDYLYNLAGALTRGEIPIIFTKGNHDNRGYLAEKLAEYTPVIGGRSYYSVRLGNIWALILDCGECCADDYFEYGNTVCHHDFRLEETNFIERIIANSQDEYNAPGVQYRLIISHSPITHIRQAPYNIEIELYSQWTKLINENIRPHFMLSGHLHILEVSEPGGRLDTLGQSCPVVIASKPICNAERRVVDYTGCALVLDDSEVSVLFTDSQKRIVGKHRFSIHD